MQLKHKTKTPNVENNPSVPTPTATRPIDLILAYGNSIPITNNNKITPISEKRFSAEISVKIPTPSNNSEGEELSGKSQVQRGDKGPISIPAKRYPIIKGCLILKNASVTIEPIIMIKAKSVTKLV